MCIESASASDAQADFSGVILTFAVNTVGLEEQKSSTPIVTVTGCPSSAVVGATDNVE
jgi:hypothetical protein